MKLTKKHEKLVFGSIQKHENLYLGFVQIFETKNFRIKSSVFITNFAFMILQKGNNKNEKTLLFVVQHSGLTSEVVDDIG